MLNLEDIKILALASMATALVVETNLEAGYSRSNALVSIQEVILEPHMGCQGGDGILRQYAKK